MNIRPNKFIILVLVLLTGLIIIQMIIPAPIDWTANYNKQDKRPYGESILFDLLSKELFPNQTVDIRHRTIFEYPEKDSLKSKNYIFITSQFAPSPVDCKRLLKLAKKGNQIFIVSDALHYTIADSLGISTKTNLNFKNLTFLRPKVMQMENPKLKHKDGFTYKKAHGRSYIDNIKNNRITVLGRDGDNKIQFVKIPLEKGNIFFHCDPLLFTNYNMVIDNHAQYMTKVFSYLPNQPIIWDEYYKPLNKNAASSPLKYILSNPALTLAYYILLISLILYMIFQGKRQQRVIPVRSPLTNSTLEFIQTVGRLYYNKRNHKDIARKKFRHFKEFIINRYHISPQGDKELMLLSKRSNIPVRTYQMLFEQAKYLLDKDQINDEELESFHSRIEFIYSNCK